MRAEREDRASKRKPPVYARATQHHPAFVLHMAKQPLVEIIWVSASRTISESDDRQVRRRTWIERVNLFQPRMNIARKGELYGLGARKAATPAICSGSHKRSARK